MTAWPADGVACFAVGMASLIAGGGGAHYDEAAAATGGDGSSPAVDACPAWRRSGGPVGTCTATCRMAAHRTWRSRPAIGRAPACYGAGAASMTASAAQTPWRWATALALLLKQKNHISSLSDCSQFANKLDSNF